ncbi:MAG: CPBP family glutamic-type intramembrane protease [Gemmatimonadota bacterium]
MPPRKSSYWSATREPRYSLTFAFPLLVLYELLAFSLTHDSINGVRNGADVLLKSLFVVLGGRRGLIVFGVLLIGTGVWLVWKDRKAHGPAVAKYFLGMMLESILYAFCFGMVAGTLTAILLHGPQFLALGPIQNLSLPTQLMISLGAGLYEELLFRVIIVSALARMARVLFGWKPLSAGIFATVVGALIFSAFHYIGPFGDPLELNSFVFRMISGLLLSALYLLRGFGVAAWTHALYDVMLALR